MDDPLDLDPRSSECLRCGTTEPMRFTGLCRHCRDDLRARLRGEQRRVEVPEYEPKVNVTPNAVALKEQ